MKRETISSFNQKKDCKPVPCVAIKESNSKHMKGIYIYLTLILFLAINVQGVAQIRKANQHFKLYKYAEAIPYYEKAYKSGNKEDKLEAVQRLADCYRLTNNVAEAKNWYQKAIEMQGVGPINHFYLGQSLRSLELYDSAAKAFKTYCDRVPNDSLGQRYYQFCVDIQPYLGIQEMAEIKNVNSINTKYSEFCPAYYNNGIVFSSDRKEDMMDNMTYGWTNFNYLDLYFSKPEYSENYWGALTEPTSMTGNFNQSYHDGPASFSKNEKVVYITKTDVGKGKKEGHNIRTHLLKIFYGVIGDHKKIKYKPFELNSKEYSVAHPTLSDDYTHLIFSSDMPGGYGGSDLYVCEYVDGEWSNARNLGESINSEGDEVFPYWANDTTLYFSSDGHLGFGGLDLFQSILEDTIWSKPTNLLKPMNSSFDDFGLIIAENGREGYFSSNRQYGMGADDIYSFRDLETLTEEEKPLIVAVPKIKVEGYVKDRFSLEPIEDATVFMHDSKTNDVFVLKTNEDGLYESEIDLDNLYVVKAMKNGYLEDCTAFRTPKNAGDNFKMPRDLLLGSLEVDQVFEVENIYYDLDKWFIRDDATPPLDNLVRILRDYPISVELSSHTDSRASYGYNMELSQKRAESAVRYIILKGIDPTRLSARGYGESKLVNKCADDVECTEEEHQQNRRTEFKITEVIGNGTFNSKFDPSLFKEGDKFNAILLPHDFFDGCLE